MEFIKINFRVENTDASSPLGLEVWLDNQQIFNQDHVTEPILFEHEVNDEEAEHELGIVLKNKTADHTQVDDQGNIIKDACLIISDLCFDEIQLGHIVVEKAVYNHDFNGSQDTIEDKFFGTMGCNGRVSIKFTTPIYLWLLENVQ